MQTEENHEFKQKLQRLIELNGREHLQHGEGFDIGKMLSAMLLLKNGLDQLLQAFNDLGGESFWQNSAVLTAIAKLLTKKPAKVQSRKKYYAFILREFLLLAKQDRWAPKFKLFMPILIEQFYLVSEHSLNVQIVDKLLRPFELITKHNQRQLTLPKNFDHFWNESIWLLSRWLNGLHPFGPFACHERLTKLIPLWTLLLGQALAFKDENVPSSSNNFDRFTTDIKGILSRLFLVQPLAQTTTSLVQMFLNCTVNPNIRLKKIQRALITLSSEENETKCPLYRFAISLTDGMPNEQERLDYRLAAFDAILENLAEQERLEFIVAMLDIIFVHMESSSTTVMNHANEMRFIVDYPNTPDPFLPHYLLAHFIELLAKQDFASNENATFEVLHICHIFLKGYIAKLREQSSQPFLDVISNRSAEIDKELANLELQSLKFIVGLICATVFQIQMEDQKTLNLLKTTAVQMVELTRYVKKRKWEKTNEVDELVTGIDKFLEFLHFDLSLDYSEQKTQKPRNKRPPTKLTNKIKNPIDSILANLEQLDDSNDETDALTSAMQGHNLIEAAKLLRQRDQKAFSSPEQFEKLYSKLTEMIENNDSYVYLAAINALAELVYWQTDTFLPRMLTLFKEWRPCGDIPSTSDDSKCMVVRARIGEALAKVARNLGDFSVYYFDAIASILFKMVNESNPMIRSSALSAFADLILACRGQYFDRHLQELLFCINQLLRFDKSELTRRAAIHLLRFMVTSVSDRGLSSLLETFSNSFVQITKRLRELSSEDQDEIVRLHAELALIEVKEAFRLSLVPLQT